MVRSSAGSEFHDAGPEKEKAHSPNFIVSIGWTLRLQHRCSESEWTTEARVPCTDFGAVNRWSVWDNGSRRDRLRRERWVVCVCVCVCCVYVVSCVQTISVAWSYDSVA